MDVGLACILKSQVPSKTKAYKPYVMVPLCSMFYYCMKVVGRTAVIKAQLSVYLAAATAVVPGKYVIPCLIKGASHTQHVAALGISFQAMTDNGKAG